MPAILEVKNLVKKYGDFTAVKGVSFSIQQGEIFSLLGPNGAGKTTTISMLSTSTTRPMATRPSPGIPFAKTRWPSGAQSASCRRI